MYDQIIETEILGYECQIGVHYYHRQKGSYSYHESNDWDYHGYEDYTYDILKEDKKAPWIEEEMGITDHQKVEKTITQHYEELLNEF